MIICLCGSTRHKESFEILAAALALEGHIVLMPHVFSSYSNISLTHNQKLKLHTLSKKQLSYAEQMIVITGKDGHVGEDTYIEICQAKKNKIPISFMNYNMILEYSKKVKSEKR